MDAECATGDLHFFFRVYDASSARTCDDLHSNYTLILHWSRKVTVFLTICIAQSAYPGLVKFMDDKMAIDKTLDSITFSVISRLVICHSGLSLIEAQCISHFLAVLCMREIYMTKPVHPPSHRFTIISIFYTKNKSVLRLSPGRSP